MARHRNLNMKRLVASVPWDFFEEYFAQLEVDRRPDVWAYINADAMFNFLDDPQNAEASAIIREDFNRINDICANGMGLLVRAYRTFNISLNQQEPDLSLAMGLFLHHRDAFNYAWGRYLFNSSTGKVTQHRLSGRPIQVAAQNVETFKEVLGQWFQVLGKGDHCEVDFAEDGDDVMFLISHGSYLRAVAHWQGERIEIRSYRPAAEDTLIYSKRRGILTTRAALEKDRAKYLDTFASCIAEDSNLAEQAANSSMFTLEPLQQGTFDFNGNGIVTNVTLVEARWKLGGRGSSEVRVKADDVLKSLEEELKGLSLSNGELTLGRFHLRLEPDGERPLTIAFEIEPPCRTDLAQKRYSEVIEAYLTEQGVLLA